LTKPVDPTKLEELFIAKACAAMMPGSIDTICVSAETTGTLSRNIPAKRSKGVIIVPLQELAKLIDQNRSSLLSKWRDQVRNLESARNLDIPTLNDHLPGLFDEIIEALRAPSLQTIPEGVNMRTAPAHGLQRVQNEFDIEEVVAEYNILRACIHDLADGAGLTLQGAPFHIINKVFDQAIGIALQAYTMQRALDVRQRREEYLAFVAHDLRTPLSAISLAGRVLERLLIPPAGGSEVVRMLNALRRNVQYLEKLVDKVLEENTNLQTEIGIQLQRRQIDLWPLVEVLIHDLHPVAGTSSTRLTNEVPEDLVVFADAALLRRVFQNLIANAIHYTPRGDIFIGARVMADGAVECSVRDNGAGIPEDLLGQIFDKGTTDLQAAGGAGLGLAIVKNFIEAHGGQVTVESAPGAGSTFRFSLPVPQGRLG
jgi:two-component system phosphate regulon sensor histidine kinase PhoR